jgi:hypothetical protein
MCIPKAAQAFELHTKNHFDNRRVVVVREWELLFKVWHSSARLSHLN